MSLHSRSQQQSTAQATSTRSPLKKLRIAFIHPDLGIGGAERLVVDAAVGLQKRGHQVQIFTSSHNPTRCFQETKDGTLQVNVWGNSIFPRALANRFITILAILRQLHLSFQIIINLWLSYLRLSSRSTEFDVYFIDQLSAAIPLLRYVTRTRVVFYCHFPDLLLSTPISTPLQSPSTGMIHRLKSIYRIPLDWIEEYTTGEADKILVNSQFTAKVFQDTFKSLNRIPRCVYPGVDVELYARPTDHILKKPLHSARPTILSINRFEDKKDLGLILEAFIIFKRSNSETNPSTSPRLIIAGGYDPRLSDNRDTLARLKTLLDAPGSPSYALYDQTYNSTTEESPDVLLIPNIEEADKRALLLAPSTHLLAYTAANEHLGIGPLEAMASGVPVLAADSGGPRETVAHEITGELQAPIPSLWAEALDRLLGMKPNERSKMSEEGRNRARKMFSTDSMINDFEIALLETVNQPIDQPNRLDIWQEERLFKTLAVLTIPMITFWVGVWAIWMRLSDGTRDLE
ncbi:family 4 glycosyltransferase [Melampsora larici-populina 98AG31]|uniref:Alpha-1,3/1,6-mannosyltransferase ALG2 n=1 Tax=Melampsora larici-populina (strain 98AG31 / pathotype 3-4-7) TaxID=747676 RepID=F4RD38_MELLP|nr:family 4 glycosyltransferase [Melampsora larici-populina 98AG31]EGG09830.1 family 4 glycosyltransferase [Melampsora larici-populina 98AG31]